MPDWGGSCKKVTSFERKCFTWKSINWINWRQSFTICTYLKRQSDSYVCVAYCSFNLNYESLKLYFSIVEKLLCVRWQGANMCAKKLWCDNRWLKAVCSASGAIDVTPQVRFFFHTFILWLQMSPVSQKTVNIYRCLCLDYLWAQTMTECDRGDEINNANGQQAELSERRTAELPDSQNSKQTKLLRTSTTYILYLYGHIRP